jgi:TrmH RNA methyltransferase
LTRISGSNNHEGLCVTTRPRRFISPGELGDRLVRTAGVAIALDRVRNPYNVGAILRTAAFFGVEGVLLGAPAPNPALAPDAVRVAEGGAEHVGLCRTTDLAQTLSRLRARGARVIGAESDAEVTALGYAFPRPLVLVVGHEREGMSERVRAECDAMVEIRGSGAIGSLNVSIAASVLIAEVMRAPVASAR